MKKKTKHNVTKHNNVDNSDNRKNNYRKSSNRKKNNKKKNSKNKKKKNIRKKKIINIVCVVAAIVTFISAFMFIRTLMRMVRERQVYDELNALVMQNTSENDIPTIYLYTRDSEESESDNLVDETPHILPEYETVYNMNNDLFGWISIADTPISYPVMYTPENPEYYLHRAFDETEAISGCLFIDAKCHDGGGIYIIYGHHMRDESMFGSLPQYADEAYREEHPLIQFNTLYSYGEYEVVAAFYSKIYSDGEEGFRYYEYTDISDENTFNEFMAGVNAAALYDTGTDVSFGDELIMLSTCNYHTENGRFVVIARKITK